MVTILSKVEKKNMEGPTEKKKTVRKYPSAREFNKHM